MTVRDDFDRLVSVWLDEAAGAGAPDYLDETLEGLANIDQRPAWMRPWRSLTMQLAMPRVVIPRAAPILLLIALLVAALIAAALLIGSPPRLPPPYGIARNGQIAFISEGQLWTSAPDGSNPRQVTSDASIKGTPIWSRDGTRIAFLTYASPISTAVPSLIVANPDGTDPVTIVEEAEAMHHVSWSPDGKLIAYSFWIEYQGQRDRIFLAASDGATDPRQIGDPDLSAFYPAFSPDSRRVAFVSDLCCPMPGGVLDYKYCGASDCFDSDTFALHVMSVDGTDITRLVHGTIQPWLESERYARLMDWRPDGDGILFTGHDIARPGSFGIFEVASDGSSPPRQLDTGPDSAYGATWSPDGERIAYLRGDTASGWEAVVARPDGSEPRVVATGIARFGPQWSPDGTRVAVVDRSSGETGSIRIVSVDGSGPVTTVPIAGLTAGSESTMGIDEIGWQRTAR